MLIHRRSKKSASGVGVIHRAPPRTGPQRSRAGPSASHRRASASVHVPTSPTGSASATPDGTRGIGPGPADSPSKSCSLDDRCCKNPCVRSRASSASMASAAAVGVARTPSTSGTATTGPSTCDFSASRSRRPPARDFHRVVSKGKTTHRTPDGRRSPPDDLQCLAMPSRQRLRSTPAIRCVSRRVGCRALSST